MLLPALYALLTLLAIALLVVTTKLLRDPSQARLRVEALFRRPAKPVKPLEADHYYRPYWS